MPPKSLQGTSPSSFVRYRQPIALGVVVLLVLLGLLVWSWRESPPTATVQPAHSYAQALEQARAGRPGAARMLYQQLARVDLADEQRIELLAQLHNYPSPQALKLLDAHLSHTRPAVRQAAIEASVRLVNNSQRSLLLGPLLEDNDQAVRFAATNALLGLSPDDLGLYFGALQHGVETFEDALKSQPATAQNQLQLARLYQHTANLEPALVSLQRAISLDPDNLEAALTTIEVLDTKGQTDQARALFATLLQRHPDSALLQHALGTWLLRHDQKEYALLSLARASELAPQDYEYRYDLAVALHDLDQLEAAQKQLIQILQSQPAHRKARVLLIQYWKENGQLQNVQVLLAELEQQNPDDPALQQGL